MTPDEKLKQDAEVAVAVRKWEEDQGYVYAGKVMREAAPAKRQARAAIQSRADAYEAAMRKTVQGEKLSGEEAAVLAAGPVTVNYEVLAEMDCRIEDATAARLLKEAIDDRDRTKAGLQAQIDNLQAENAKAWQAVADVDRKHADAVSEARRVIADWEADRNAIILKINCRQQEAQDLAAQREKVGYVDHVAHLKMRRQIDRERKREADLRHEAGQYKTTEELQFTDADRHSALNPKVGDDDVKYRAIGLPP